MKIHFICLGNTFRSRLAEAYAKSLFTKDEISSSGIEANQCMNGHITWYAQYIAQMNGIANFLHPVWRQTKWSEVAKNDVIICLDEHAKQEAILKLKNSQRIQYFDIKDVKNSVHKSKKVFSAEISSIEQAEKSYFDIKQTIDNNLYKGIATKHNSHLKKK